MEHVSPEDYDDRISEGESYDGESAPRDGSSLTSPSATSNAIGAKPQQSSHLQKRRRVTRACDECRRKKIKCDGKQPCTHCTVYSYGERASRLCQAWLLIVDADCTYDQPSNRRRNPAPQYVENLEHRVHRAETLLHILIPNLDLNDPGIEAAVAQGWIPGAPGKGNPSAARQRGTAPQPPAAAPSVENKSDTNLESMVRAVAQMDIDEQGNWDYHGHSSGLSFVRRMREQLGDLMGPDTVSTPFVKSRPRSTVLDSPRSAINSPSADTTSSESELPPKDVARGFCANAVNDAAALLRVLHKPTFWQSFERIYSIPQEHYTNEDQKFLPLLYSTMALGTLFGNHEHSSLNQNGYENAIQQGFAYFRAARQMMDIADVRDLTSVQAVVFMILFMQSSAKLSQCYAYVGVALRSALRMGLHRAYSANLDPIELETRKRVFWVIRKMDIYVGAMLGLPQTLSDDDIDQEFPAEVDDEYITRDDIRSMPDGEVSLMTAFNAHTRIVLLISKIVRKVYPIKIQSRQGEDDKSYTVPFSVIREIEGDLESWKNSLPPILSPCSAPEKYVRVQQLLRLAYAHAQVMLYRPFLHFVATDKRSKPVDQRAYACAASYVNVSRNIIHITTQMKHKGLLNGAFWFIMYTTFFSILSLVYFAAENPDNPTTEAVMKDALEGKQVLASLTSRSMAADRCTATLDVVFNRLPNWMREGRENPSASRKRPYAPSPQPQQGRQREASHSHPDVSSAGRETPKPGFVRRASTFPNNSASVPKVESHSNLDTPWTQSGTSSFGPQTPTTNGGFDSGFMGFNNATDAMVNGMSQYSLPPNFANPAIPDVSAMMFPSGGDEPFSYPNQPLTTFENNRQFAKNNPYMNAQGFNVDDANNLMLPASRGRDDNMEAQFFALPPYMEQARQQQHQATGFPRDSSAFSNGMPLSNGQPMQLPRNAWHGQQQGFQQQPAFSDINIQELFGGAEWNPSIMDPGYRPN